MKKREFQELKNNPIPELEKKLVDFREKLRGLIFDLASGKIKNAREIKECKKILREF